MTTYKVSELEGALLDMAVAEAEGLNPVLIAAMRAFVVSKFGETIDLYV